MPFPNFHACRLINPDEFKAKSFVTIEREHEGKKYNVVRGKLKEDDSWADQAYRYPKDNWSVDEARQHCKDHKGILFEPASDEENSLRREDCGADLFEGELVERRMFAMTEIRAVSDQEGLPPEIVGTAAVYNARSEVIWGFQEEIEPGFFEGVLSNDVRACWNHNTDLVLGRTKANTLLLRDDIDGLHITILPPDTGTGKDAMISIKRGDVDQMSFMFQVKPGGDEWKQEGDLIIRTLKRGGCERLFEISPVTFPAYPQTSVSVRSAFEEFKSRNPATVPGQEPGAEQTRDREARAHLANLHKRLDLAEKA